MRKQIQGNKAWSIFMILPVVVYILFPVFPSFNRLEYQSDRVFDSNDREELIFSQESQYSDNLLPWLFEEEEDNEFRKLFNLISFVFQLTQQKKLDYLPVVYYESISTIQPLYVKHCAMKIP